MSVKGWAELNKQGAVAKRRPLANGLRCMPGLSALALTLGIAAAGCESHSMDVPDPTVIGPNEPGGPSTDGTGPGGQNPPVACEPGRLGRRAVWLSDIQYANTITTLLGADALDAEQVPDPAFKAFSQKGTVVNTSLLRTRLDIGQRAASSLDGKFTERTGCATTDDTCARNFVNDLAERAFRRPMAADERTDLATVYDKGKETSIETGVHLAIQAILASPAFNYRTEFGAEGGAGGVVKLTDNELAGMLSYWLTDGPPDADLMAAAAQGKLSSDQELGSQVARLLDKPQVQNTVIMTLMSAWNMSNLFDATKDPMLFPQYGPLLQSAMFEETRLFLNDALWGEGGSLGKALTSNKSFINKDLADLYGVTLPAGAAPNQFTEVELPADQRAGFLTQGSFLAGRARSDNTSVVARGLFVRTALLCLPRPPPPPEAVIAQVQALLAADLTEKERADFRAKTSPCNGCHINMDAFGLMLEKYDPIGRYREELKGAPVDDTVSLDAVGFPGTFDGVVDFVTEAAESPQYTACIARHLAVYATGEDALATRDCELQSFMQQLPADTTLREVVTALASSDLLRTRSAGEGQ